MILVEGKLHKAEYVGIRQSVYYMNWNRYSAED